MRTFYPIVTVTSAYILDFIYFTSTKKLIIEIEMFIIFVKYEYLRRPNRRLLTVLVPSISNEPECILISVCSIPLSLRSYVGASKSLIPKSILKIS